MAKKQEQEQSGEQQVEETAMADAIVESTPDTAPVMPEQKHLPDNVPYSRFQAVIAEKNAAQRQITALKNELAGIQNKHAEELDRLQSELEKSSSALEEQRTVAATVEANVLKLKIGIAAGLPMEMAQRLQGNTEDEMKEDAKKLAALLPTRSSSTVGVPGGKATGESEIDKRKRFFGGAAATHPMWRGNPPKEE